MFSIRETLQTAKKRIDSLDAQALLGHVLQVERAYLLAHPEQGLTAEQVAQFETLVERIAAGEPLAYLLGRRAFYDRDFYVSPAVLIPRPETELLLEQALVFMRQHPQAAAVDVGTGSGALAVTLAANCAGATIYATDISPEALAVARRNADEHRVSVTFWEGDLLLPLIERGLKVNVVMANLPYISRDELRGLEVSQYEPHLALDGGADGLEVIRRLLAQAPAVCETGALILLEIGADQGAAAQALAQAAFPAAQVDVLKDYAGHDRVVRALLSG